jgi:hypothetical protein
LASLLLAPSAAAFETLIFSASGSQFLYRRSTFPLSPIQPTPPHPLPPPLIYISKSKFAALNLPSTLSPFIHISSSRSYLLPEFSSPPTAINLSTFLPRVLASSILSPFPSCLYLQATSPKLSARVPVLVRARVPLRMCARSLPSTIFPYFPATRRHPSTLHPTPADPFQQPLPTPPPSHPRHPSRQLLLFQAALHRLYGKALQYPRTLWPLPPLCAIGPGSDSIITLSLFLSSCICTLCLLSNIPDACFRLGVHIPWLLLILRMSQQC